MRCFEGFMRIYKKTKLPPILVEAFYGWLSHPYFDFAKTGK